jgi:hypothetical protein
MIIDKDEKQMSGKGKLEKRLLQKVICVEMPH